MMEFTEAVYTESFYRFYWAICKNTCTKCKTALPIELQLLFALCLAYVAI